MADDESRSAKRKRVTIGFDDLYTVFQRYSESTVITLYQEIAECCGEKIEWKELVKQTSTGIKNAREYQMLWRHLAYRHPLQEKIEDGEEPLGDESDLETDLEAIPAGSAKHLAEAEACVKVLLGSGSPSNSIMANNLAATASLAANENLTSAVLKNSRSAVPRRSCAPESSNDPAVTGGNPPSKKKRHMWSTEDDRVLIAGVKKFGVGNWATISRQLFSGERNAAQVGSRWKLLKEKECPGSNSAVSNVNGQQLSNELATIATRNAISMALKMPVTLTTSSAGRTSVNQLSQAASSMPHLDRARLTKPTVPVKSLINPDSVLLATAMAAGARIATPEAAESLLKVAHANNAVHIMHGGGSSIKKSGSFSQLPTSHLVTPHHCGSELATSKQSNSSAVMPSVQKADVISSSAGTKAPSFPIKEELIPSTEAASKTCNSIEEQNQQVQDHPSVPESPKEDQHQNPIETRSDSLAVDSGKE